MDANWSAGELVEAAAARRPAALGVADIHGTRLTWAELDGLANATARGLCDLGLRKGDRVLTVLSDRAEYVVLHAAIAKAGLVLVPGSWRFKARELAHIAADARPAAVVFEDEAAERVGEAVAASGATPALVEVGAGGSIAGASHWSELAAGRSTARIDLATPEDLLYIGYTSGTTGRPKGVMADHRGVRMAAFTAAQAYGLPFHGAAAMSASLSFFAAIVDHLWSNIAMTCGIAMVGPFDVERLVAVVEAEEATFTYLPTPTIADGTAALARSPAALRSLRAINIGGSLIPAGPLAELVAVAGDRVVQTYGLSEGLGTPLCAGRAQDWERAADGYATAGRPVSPARLALRDPDGRPVPHDGAAAGELMSLSPIAMRGYWEDAEATAEVLLPDGWLATGDVASIDRDGYVTIRGRAKETIISGGINVHPAEIEGALRESPLVADAAVVGAPDAQWGEAIVAFVVAAAGADAGALPEHVREFCRERLAHYKCPRRVHLVPDLPRNPNGKVVKRELAERAVALHG
jgi:fatty-acyl-CoA synthase